MNCQSCQIEIEELELGAHLSGPASAHIDACLPCGAFYDERLALRRLVGSLDPISAPPDFEFRLRARLAEGGSAVNHRFSLRSLIASAPALGLAASFALLVAAVVIYNQFKTGPEVNRTVATVEVKAADQPQPNSEPSSVQTSASSSTQQGPGVTPPRVTPNATPSPIVPNSTGTPRPSIAVNNGSAMRRPKQAGRNAAQIISHDEAVRSAPQIRPAPGTPSIASSANQLVELPVRSASQPVRVFVDDSRGVRRSVTLEPVIFGSQDLTGRGGFRPVSSQGIW